MVHYFAEKNNPWIDRMAGSVHTPLNTTAAGQQMKRFEWVTRLTAKVTKAREEAIEQAGGASHVSRELGVSRPVIERIRWGDTRTGRKSDTDTLDAVMARRIVDMAQARGGKANLKEVAPQHFKGLTVKALGYTPKDE